MSRGRKTEGGLSELQLRFVDEYLKSLSVKDAAVKAGYSPRTAAASGSRVMAMPEVKRLIAEKMEERQERVKIEQDDILRGLLEVAQISMGRKRAVITQKKTDADGNICYEDESMSLFDSAGANKALELLGKHLSMFTEKLDVNMELKESALEALIEQEQKSRLQSQKLAEKLELRKEL